MSSAYGPFIIKTKIIIYFSCGFFTNYGTFFTSIERFFKNNFVEKNVFLKSPRWTLFLVSVPFDFVVNKIINNDWKC